MKTAIIHDWLTGMRGGEKVLEALAEIFPDADIYTMVYKKGSVSKAIASHPIYTSFLNKIPFASKIYKFLNPLYPLAVEQFDLSRYDLVISSSHAAVKGVITPPDTIHISYVHTPVRYYWDQYNEYFKSWPFFIKPIIGTVATFYRVWDISTMHRIDHIIANSSFVAKRIKKYYGKDSTVIYPPVDIHRFEKIYQKSEDYYVLLAALVPYKRVDIAVQAFNKSGRKLKIIGKGEELQKLQAMANDAIEFLGRISDDELYRVYAHAKAFIFTAVEDFGISAIEAQSAGLPVIAYAKGGARETIIDQKTGIFYYSQDPDALNAAITASEQIAWNKALIKKHAEAFSKEAFIKSFATFTNTVLGFHAPTPEQLSRTERKDTKEPLIKEQVA